VYGRNLLLLCMLGGAGGGNRTLTGGDPHGILSPARLPVSPLRLTVRIVLHGDGATQTSVRQAEMVAAHALAQGEANAALQ
jgi:hypothetical protein